MFPQFKSYGRFAILDMRLNLLQINMDKNFQKNADKPTFVTKEYNYYFINYPG